MTPPREPRDAPSHSAWRHRLHTIIFEADTPAGFAFDVALLVSITLSVLVVMLASIPGWQEQHGGALYAAEWLFTLLFTVEYVLRLLAVDRPLRYAASFYGIIDLLSVLPTWISPFVAGAESLLAVRVLRLIRIFRIFKLGSYLNEAQVLVGALRRSQRKVTVFLATVLSLVVVLGSMMYVVEGPEHGFTSIPVGMYWAVVTITTVGYGDISPGTPLGQFIASFTMILGYAIIAVPTGIVTVELTSVVRTPPTTQACPSCSAQGHDLDAAYCKYCAARLHP